MSRLERYTLEDRVKNHWRNPEWEKLAGKENRPKRILQDPDVLFRDDYVSPFKKSTDTPPEATESPTTNDIPKDNGVFPFETGQPMQAEFPYPMQPAVTRDGEG